MTIYISLLRGINVGGKQMKMAELKAMCEGLGLTKVQTYIQSGNVLFESDSDAATLQSQLEAGIGRQFGFKVTVAMRTLSQWEALVAGNPFEAPSQQDPKQVHATVLVQPLESIPDPLPTWPVGTDQFVIQSEVVYLYCPDGYGRTKLHNEFWEKQLKVGATTRNWNSVLKLLELARAMG